MSHPTIEAFGMTWIHISMPDEHALLSLQRKFHFHKLDIDDCLSENERPKVESYPSYLFFVFHFPKRFKGGNRIVKDEIDLFVGQDFMVTFSETEKSYLDELWKSLKASPKKREEYMINGSGYFLYKIMHDYCVQGFPLVDDIRRELRRIEGELFESEENAIFLRDILSLKRNIITMRNMISPLRPLIPVIQHKHRTLIPESLSIYFDDVHDAIERQWSLLEAAKELSDALQETHESWLTHKTNNIMRILTVFSVTLLPLNVLTGMYGMNVTLPLQGQPMVFAIIICVMCAIVVGFFAYFAWKKWL